jgi:ribosome-associated toxin RatA of RatAB toxin-antitoxin module
MALETIYREHTIDGIAPRDVYDVVVDYACYPRVFPEFTGVRVLSELGHRKRVEFRAVVVVDVRYVLDVVHDPGALTTRWSFVEGDVVSDSEGGWTLSGDASHTVVRYRAGFSFRALPKLLANKIANALVTSHLPERFHALETEAVARRTYAAAW